MAHSVSVEQFLNVRSATTPKFAPDGCTLAYLSNESGVWQVWALDLSDPDAASRQLTFHDDAVSNIAYAPDRDDLIYVMDSGGDERHQFHLLSNGAASTALTELPDVMHNWGGWSRDGANIAFTANRRDPALMDAFVMDVASGEATRVFDADGWYTVAAIAPDTARLLLLESTGSSDQELHLLTVKTGERQPFTRHADRCRYQCCRWRADGAGIYALTNQGRDHLGIALFDTASGELVWLYTPDNDVEEIALSKDETRLASVTNVDGYARLAVHDLANGETTEAPPLPPGKITALDWSPDGERLAFALNGSTHNADIWLWDLNDDTVRQITRSDRAGADRSSWIEPQLIHFQTFDDRRIPAFLYLPPGQAPAAGFPAVIFVHGGPESQYLPEFRPDIQFLLARGYAVLAPNVRGSTGYGAAYAALDDVYKRMDSVADLKHARLWLGARADIDDARIAVYGGSYGGFMVLAAITEYPDLWKTAVNFYGIADFQTFFERTGPWRRKHRAMEYGDPVRDADFLKSISPIHKVDRIQVPLFVAQGLMDPRVPPHESEQIVAALRDRGLPVDYVTVPDEGHGFMKLPNRIKIYGAMAEFLDRYL